MRQIGTIAKQLHAERFTAFLITRGINAQAEDEGDAWAIWVRDEDKLAEAKSAFADFKANPDAPGYQGVERQATAVLEAEHRRREKVRKNMIEMRGNWDRVARKKSPLVVAMIVLSVVVALISGLGTNSKSAAMRSLQFCDTMQRTDWNKANVEDRLIDIHSGQVWRVITPIFVHFGVLHIAFNMILFYSFGSRIEDRLGSVPLGLMIVLVAIASNLAQALVPAQMGGDPFFGGMSGVVYGLLGYLWVKTVYDPGSGLFVSQSTFLFLMIWLFIGFSGILESGGLFIANWAHGVGLVAGMAIAYVPLLMRR